MYQPYPTGAQMPVHQRPPIPRSVTNAVVFLCRRSSSEYFKGAALR